MLSRTETRLALFLLFGVGISLCVVVDRLIDAIQTHPVTTCSPMAHGPEGMSVVVNEGPGELVCRIGAEGSEVHVPPPAGRPAPSSAHPSWVFQNAWYAIAPEESVRCQSFIEGTSTHVFRYK